MAARRLVLNGLTAEVAAGRPPEAAGPPSPEFYHELELYRQLLALPVRRCRTPDPPPPPPVPRCASAGPPDSESAPVRSTAESAPSDRFSATSKPVRVSISLIKLISVSNKREHGGAAIVPAALQDIGLVTEDDCKNVVDRSKIRRARTQTRSSQISTQLDLGQSIQLDDDSQLNSQGKNVDLRSYQSLQGAKLELQRRVYDLIEWDKVSEPPVLKQISTDLLKDAIANPDIVETEILTLYSQMPCHTQASERCIKIVTEACSAVCGPERREGWIKNTLKSCKIMLIFNTKAEYRTK
ncbi:unnamed protein product [Pieris macdunnoughi]|uniref:Uncharacterized protein n=1 Tax=Pieris macdunnoughi TaxID=345717 RepID=A0A821YCH0_9NEOP|nr:unnamed protein product [Pieris macdunnoughi]